MGHVTGLHVDIVITRLSVLGTVCFVFLMFMYTNR